MKAMLRSGSSGRTGFFGLLLCLAGLGAAAAALPPEEEKLASANSGFAFALLKQIVKEQPGTNIFISPYSAGTVLKMIGNGAAGKTKEEMEHVLGTSGMTAQSLNRACKEMDESVRSAQSNVVLTLANSIWYRPGVELRPEFASVNQDFYGATLSALDFTDPRSAGAMNRWAEEATQGRIKTIIEPPIPGSFQVFLANAIYFKGTWLLQFDQKQTSERPFYLSGGGQKPAPMMRQKARFSYQGASGFQAVRLPYAGDRLGMYVLLPATNSSIEKLLLGLDGRAWQANVLPKFEQREGTLVLPRFKLEYGVQLKKPLQALGLRLAFERDADFSAMSATPLFLDEVKQKAFVEVSEEGTEAAAVTLGGIRNTAVRETQKPFEMVADRPFLFVIEDSQAKAILFVGAMFEPAL